MDSSPTISETAPVIQEQDWSKYSRLPLAPEAGVPLEGVTLNADTIEDFESENHYPYIAEKLGFKHNFKVDPQLEMKVRAVDGYIRLAIKNEGLRNSKVGYETVLARLLDRSTDSLERVVRHGDAKSLLDRLFSDIAFENKLSSKSYLERFEREYRLERISKAKQSLKEALSK